MQVAIIKNGKIIKLSIWNSQYSVQYPCNSQHSFPINSMTKCFTGTALVKLIENGQIKLDDYASVYLSNLPEPWHKITIKQLLTHTSGLPDIVDGDTGKMIVPGEDTIALEKVKPYPFTLLRERNQNTTKPIMYSLVRSLKNYQKAFYLLCNRAGICSCQYATNEFWRFLRCNKKT